MKAYFNGDSKKTNKEKLLDKAVGRLTKSGKVSTEAAVLKTEADIEEFYAAMKARFADASVKDEAVKKAVEENKTAGDVLNKVTA